MEAGDLKTWTEIVGNAITALAILAGGLWALYVFVIGRSSTAQVQVELDLKRVISAGHHNIALVSVKLTNTGRTRVQKDIHKDQWCLFGIQPVTSKLTDQEDLRKVDVSPDPIRYKMWPVFPKLRTLEPNEEAAEDVVFAWDSRSCSFLGDIPTFSVEVRFIGRVLFDPKPRSWVSRRILVVDGQKGTIEKQR